MKQTLPISLGQIKQIISNSILLYRKKSNLYQYFQDPFGEVDGKTIHRTETLISINFLQMFSGITWAKKISL